MRSVPVNEPRSSALVVLVSLSFVACSLDTEGVDFRTPDAGAAEAGAGPTTDTADGEQPPGQPDPPVSNVPDLETADPQPVEAPECGIECLAPTCEADAECALACDGGECEHACAPGSQCEVEAEGALRVEGFHRAADVSVACDDAARCETTCQGGECEVGCAGTEQCTTRCSDGAECDTDCAGSAQCGAAVCESGAECVLRCEDSARCGFVRCEGPQRACGGGVIVCNRACPDD